MQQIPHIWRIFPYLLLCLLLSCQSTPPKSPTPNPQSPIPTPLRPDSPTSDPLPPIPDPQGTLLFSSRQIDTNGDGFVQVPDAIQIYRMDLATGIAAPLTQNEAYNTYPAWSPDGSQIAYVSTASGGVDLFVMDADGGNSQLLTINSQQSTVNSQRVASPSWAPDGEMIVFSGGDSDSSNLYVYSMGSGEVRQITDSELADLEPDWSENGRFILFTRHQPTGTTEPNEEVGLYLYDIELDQAIKIQKEQTRLVNIRWLPESNTQFTAQEKNDSTLSMRLYELVWEGEEVFLRETAVLTENALELIWLHENQFITVTPLGESSELVFISHDNSESTSRFLTNNSFFESNIDWLP